MKRLFLGSDHAGFRLKQFVHEHITNEYKTVLVHDVGTHDNASCHYPDFAEKIALQIKGEDKGIVVCGSGIGIGIAMVKAGVPCATCFNEYMAEECGKGCQVMAVGERVITPEIMRLMIKSFMGEWAT